MTSEQDRADLHPISRRGLLAGATACLAVSSRIARAQGAPHAFKVGAIEATVISDGTMRMPLSFVLPRTEEAVVAQLLASRGQPTELTAQVNVLVVRTGDGLVLVDTGGTKDFSAMLGSFADRFEAAGLKPDQVTDIVVTHAHPDHLWGAIDEFDEPKFPKARVHMAVAERDFWLKDGLVETLPETLKGMASGTRRRLKILEEKITAAKPGVEILPGISFVETPGHTPGHASVLLASSGQTLLVGGDALSSPVISFEKPDWAWGPDMDADKAIATRKSLLDRLATDRTALLGYHLPWPGLGRVERKDGAYRFVVG